MQKAWFPGFGKVPLKALPGWQLLGMAASASNMMRFESIVLTGWTHPLGHSATCLAGRT